jgi:hypothetical protein
VSASGRINLTYRIGGATVDAVIDRTEEQGATTQIPLPAGVPGTLTTRTDDDTGVVTVASGHGITTSDTVTLFWAGGIRRRMAVTATTATTISIDLGSGDNLPLQSSVCVISKEVITALGHDGDDLAIFVVHCVNRLMADIRDADPATIVALDIAARESWAYISGFSGTNPFATETLVTAVLANGGTTAATANILHLKNTLV